VLRLFSISPQLYLSAAEESADAGATLVEKCREIRSEKRGI
jgi:hypothetical protein